MLVVVHGGLPAGTEVAVLALTTALGAALWPPLTVDGVADRREEPNRSATEHLFDDVTP